MRSLWKEIQTKLDEISRRIGLRGLTLANQDGLLLASSGHDLDFELLAAVGPLMESGRSNSHLLQSSGWEGLSVRAHTLGYAGQNLFLCAAGDELQVDDPQLTSLTKSLGNMLGT